MAIKYFKLDTLIETRCEHCGALRKETLGRLYSHDRLICTTCGREHTPNRDEFRRTVEETEASISGLPDWTFKWARKWLKNE